MRILPAPGADLAKTGNWQLSVIYYDDKGRAIYTGSLKLDDQSNVIQRHYTGSQYDFAGRVLVTKHQSFNANSQDGQTTHTELIKNTYNAYTGQLEQVTHKVNNGGWKLLVSYLYDDMGRIKKETLGSYAEERNYDYDMNGRLTGINALYAESGSKSGQSQSFGESLKYDYGFSQPRYDGKVSGMVWRGAGGLTAKAMAYGYDYDKEGRLISADFNEAPEFFQPTIPTSWSNADRDYTVSNLNYDRNGNIQSMDQKGMGIVQGGMQPVDMDQLSYTYEANSNQLTKVTDQVPDDYQLGDFINGNSGQSIDYEYDANGNLTKDLNKGISKISYTYFNKPQTISFADGNSISYSYDAAGGKVQELIMNSSVAKRTDYAGNFIYQNDSLQYALTPVGRTVWENGTAKEEFFVKDHLGNVRSVVVADPLDFMAYLGSYELASANLENLVFDFHGDIRDDKPGSIDSTDLKAGRLNGAETDRRIGTALLLKVMAGDRVELNADNYYENYEPGSDEPVSAEDLLENILTVLSGGAGGFEGGEIHNPGFVNELFHPANFTAAESLLRSNEDPQRPKAYLNSQLSESLKKQKA